MMEEEPCHSSNVSAPSSSATPSYNPCSSSSASTSQLQAEEANHQRANEGIQHNHRHRQQLRGITLYRFSISFTDPSMTAMRDDVWSCIVVLVTFWLVAIVTLALGIYGSVKLQLGPYCSHLIETNSMLVQSVKVEQIDKPKPGLVLYGFDEPPPLDVKINWTDTYTASIPAKTQKEWIFYLNQESQLEVFYNVKSQLAPLSLVIAKGREGLVQWIKGTSVPSATLYWNIIYGSATITQKVSQSFTYFVAIGNMNPENVEIELNFTVNAVLFNTSNTYHRCSLDKGLCKLNLALSKSKTAVLTTPGPGEVLSDDEECFNVKVSYEPRWIIYFVGSGVMAVIILVVFRFCNVFQGNGEERSGLIQQVISERTPLLLNNDDDLSSWGSSYESFCNEEEDLTMKLAENSIEGKQVLGELTDDDLKRLCAVCFDAPRDCFFLPCGHCAACFACGTRIAEESCTCPICRRSLKKIRKIFTV